MSVVIGAGLRPLRRFAAVMALACLAAAAATAVTATLAVRSQVVVVGEAAAGQPIVLRTARGSGSLVVLASRPQDVSADASDTCSLSGARHSTKIGYVGIGPAPVLHRDGTVLTKLASVDAGWRDGERLTCSGPHLVRIAVVQDHRPSLLLWAAGSALMTLGTGVMALVGFGSRRARARAA